MTRLLLRVAAAAVAFTTLISTATAQTATASAPSIFATGSCYSSIPSDFKNMSSYTFQTSGYCQGLCKGYPVMAITQGSTCFCGTNFPSSSLVVSEDQCNTGCNGFDTQTCGGPNAYQLYSTGFGTPGGNADPGTSSSGNPSSVSSTVPSVVTQSGKIVTVTAASTNSASSEASGGGGSSKVGIAVGVVVGIIAIAGIAGGLVLFMKRRRRLALEEEHRRNAAVNGFVNGAKSETSSTADSRLDPTVFSHRRNSIGSIADEQDFTRRILQVRNPDRESKASNMA